MNLRKALDRAKKEREVQGDAVVTPVAKGGPTDGSSWQPPVYSESRTVAIDIPTAVENHCVGLSTEFPEINYYKVLRTQLRQMGQKKDWNTVMVTSASPNEGKTVTAINLAATLAQSGFSERLAARVASVGLPRQDAAEEQGVDGSTT